ncbi:MAG TPA: hypothetical protein VN699_05340 [Pirellulales bacterium]|nr:hypothetical protein [Pirellulales bacterium]
MKFCSHCEAELTPGPAAAEEAAAAGALSAMGPDVANELLDAMNESATGEEFVNRIMVGDCPQCGSSNTGDSENDPEIEDPCVGRCFDCGLLWCLDCGELFKDAQFAEHGCPAWEEMGLDDDDWDEAD